MDNVGDVESMATHSILILKDDQKLAAFKEGALNRAKDFELSLIVPIYEAYYKEVMESASRL